MQVGNFKSKHKTFVVAEIGTNHNGDFQLAKELIRQVAATGADGVKFQTFSADSFIHKDLMVIPHARGIHKTQYERILSLQFNYNQFGELKRLSDELGVIFISTPFDKEAVGFLEDIVPFYKVASGDITNIPLLKHIASKQKPILLSIGAANDEEIEKVLKIFPKENVVLLHCVCNYPTPIEEANLNSIPYLREKFNVQIGYSDHTIGLNACKIAISLGAVIIEKHFTNDKNQPIGDHKISMDFTDLEELLKETRLIETALGVYGKPIDREKNARRLLRRSLYAKVDIDKGTKLTEKMIAFLRPSDGLAPDKLKNIVDKIAKENVKKNTLLSEEMFI